jgi:hypothetical protein
MGQIRTNLGAQTREFVKTEINIRKTTPQALGCFFYYFLCNLTIPRMTRLFKAPNSHLPEIYLPFLYCPTVDSPKVRQLEIRENL